jgi:hypothetical protein
MFSQRAKLIRSVVAAPNLANHQLLDDSISFETIPRSTSLSLRSRYLKLSGLFNAYEYHSIPVGSAILWLLGGL